MTGSGAGGAGRDRGRKNTGRGVWFLRAQGCDGVTSRRRLVLSGTYRPCLLHLGTTAALHIKNKSPRYLQLPSSHTPHFFQQKRKLVFY